MRLISGTAFWITEKSIKCCDCRCYSLINHHNHAARGYTVSQISEQRASAYWRRNLSLVFKLLIVWFVVSFGCGILLVDFLNQFQLGGYKLGFWFAQQGSIYVFVVLTFYYARRMAALDKEYGVDEERGE